MAGIVVFVTAKDKKEGLKIARILVEKKMAACCNILTGIRSVYRWQGAVQEDGEIPLIIKTTAELYPALETYLRSRHPYELPEILALDVVAGLPDYLQWVVQSTSTGSADSASDLSSIQA